MSDSAIREPLLGNFTYPAADVVECPYPYYDALRREAPVHRLDNGDYIVSRWEDIVAVAQQPVLFSSFVIRHNHGALGDGAPGDIYEPCAVIFSDPPEHRVKRAFCLPLRSAERLSVIEAIPVLNLGAPAGDGSRRVEG